MKKLILFLLLTSNFLLLTSQTNPPKLVIGIVVDQMRYDYVYKYWTKYGDKGFKRLVNEGYFFTSSFLLNESTQGGSVCI